MKNYQNIYFLKIDNNGKDVGCVNDSYMNIIINKQINKYNFEIYNNHKIYNNSTVSLLSDTRKR